MNKPNTVCRVCGKEYFCCADSRTIGSWRTMACSEEHYKEYIRRIEESRKPKVAEVMEESITEEIPIEEIIEVEKPKKIKSKYSAKEVENKDEE